ncbi:hypothetical protein COT42_07255 [Candidatus Saganbacteria bacterium CG08_land_8_20_14_0_20_45_16]|uniref:PKD domain-containing protein n=1 Tax=Candidatus Saganbacteria bacterium CG08_land_8_20_14_0_20_45_16 TaxID=2014293 RepID=A0A2H0XUY5_UNCSA|nr:MAG: hypothetical protein COT42_07255 [Candidatus Saganbacteria bacterium CG08_land_8_20_14_0_20_45_16]
MFSRIGSYLSQYFSWVPGLSTLSCAPNDGEQVCIAPEPHLPHLSRDETGMVCGNDEITEAIQPGDFPVSLHCESNDGIGAANCLGGNDADRINRDSLQITCLNNGEEFSPSLNPDGTMDVELFEQPLGEIGCYVSQYYDRNANEVKTIGSYAEALYLDQERKSNYQDPAFTFWLTMNGISYEPNYREIPDFGTIDPRPQAAMSRGSDNIYNWQIDNLTDDFGNRLHLIDSNANYFLNNNENFSSGYTERNTYRIQGQMLPNAGPGTFYAIFSDDYGHTRRVTFYQPTITPLEFNSNDISWYTVNPESPYWICINPGLPVSGATNYLFSATFTDPTTNETAPPYAIASQPSNCIAFSPTRLGDYSLQAEITTYSGDILNARTTDTITAHENGTAVLMGSMLGVHTAHIGDDVVLMGNSSDPDATYDWEILPPRGDVMSFNGQTASFTAELEGDYDVRLVITSSDGRTQKVISRDIEVYPPYTIIPSATISRELTYSYHLGDTARDIICRSDDPAATFAWTVTRPAPNEHGEVIERFAGPVIRSYTFDSIGDFDFRCTVVASDSITTSGESRSVNVYPSNVELPLAGMAASFAAEVGTDVVFATPSPDTSRYSYTWEFVDDGSTETGTEVTHNFAETGTYMVRLTVASLADPTLKNSVVQTITIVPIGVEIPTLSIVGLPAVHEDTPFTLSVADPDTDNFVYTWEIAGEPTPVTGASITHTFNNPGQYGVVLRATSRRDSSVSFVTPAYYIYVIQNSIPLPNLSIIAPFSGQVSTATTTNNIRFRASDPSPEYNYSFDFVGSASAMGSDVTHAFNELGTYSVILTATLRSDPSVTYQITHNITIVPYHVPNVGIEGPLSAPVNTAVSYNVPEPTPGATYTWHFGDGTTATGTSVSHTYRSIADFQVRLTADNHGTTNEIRHNITIY